MPGSARKFHSRNKFGKKRKKSLANNFKARLPPGSVDEERDGSPAAAAADVSLSGVWDAPTDNSRVCDEGKKPLPRRSAERADEDRGSVSPTPAADKERFAESPEAADGELGLAGQPACGVTTNSGRVRRDTLMLTPSDLQARQTKADTKLRELASTAATKRKFDFFDDSNDAPASAAPTQQSDEESFFIADIQCLSGLLGVLKCKFCGGGNVSLYKREREYGLAVKVCVSCANCGDIAEGWSSPRVDGDQKVNPFAVNILAARAMQSTGNRQAAMNDIFSTMNISHRGLHKKTWQGYVKQKLTPAATRAAEKVTSECATSVRQLYKELDIQNANNIAVSFDGSWMTRGHSSHIGVGAVIELFTGLVLDYVVLSNFCAGCERGPKENDPAYQTWRDSHMCQKNTAKKAGEMEVEAAVLLFNRSLRKNGLRYTTILSDGDSRAFHALQEADVYGFIKIQKEDCVNHVQKRMGTALRNLIARHKGGSSETLGGRGRLTGDLITKLSSYYGWALKSHKGDVEAMQRAVMATYHHVTSNDNVSNHSLCPAGPDSWCRQNAAAAKGEPAPRHHYNLPPHVSKALLPIYERLSERKLLERCQRGKTQNNNESLHSLIWALAPKERHASLFTVEAAVAEAVMKFNCGNLRTSSGILEELSLNPSLPSTRRMNEKDRHRAAESTRKHASTERVQQALKKRHYNAKQQSDYIPGGF
ncbi:hypothetical protein HPB49_001406 [Dermacentor silvarum]|uniref:Uncharacterized protein n=1 Tax=Dermacentor silvarum TaxID=543639 RepID=A0ACB8D232_DERSI|nr:hypothetical protein HPB49_001406 [Dermacentor silvarum]